MTIPNYVKAALFIAIVSSAIAWFDKKLDDYYTSGYNKAVTEYEQEKIKLIEKKDSEAEIKLRALQKTSDDWKEKAQRKQQTIIVTEKIYETIENTVYECSDLGDNFMHTFNANRTAIFANDFGEGDN